MRLKTLLLSTGAAASMATGAFAEAHMGNDMTIVSWGGAYQESQRKAYADPYMANNDGVTVVWDESSNEAVAKLRAMNEAGNVTWDLVDVVASDAIRLCDEGLAMEIDADELLAEGDDGTPASEDFGDLLVSDCFIPQIVYSTTAAYRPDLLPEGAPKPESICAMFDTETYPGNRALEKRPINNLEWALICDGVAKEDVYDVLETEEGQDQAFAKLDTIKDQTVWWSAAAEPPQLLADGEIVMGSSYNGRWFSAIEE
ncbi:hypothetical protein LCGC14_1782630, partial [marine sediment metagenome]